MRTLPQRQLHNCARMLLWRPKERAKWDLHLSEKIQPKFGDEQCDYDTENRVVAWLGGNNEKVRHF
jgi:hypothetical protein